MTKTNYAETLTDIAGSRAKMAHDGIPAVEVNANIADLCRNNVTVITHHNGWTRTYRNADGIIYVSSTAH